MLNLLPKYQRLLTLILVLLLIGASVFFALKGFQEEVAFFKKPSEFSDQKVDQKKYRIGGIVKEGSFKYDFDLIEADFILTDHEAEIKVHYEGVLPDLFRENQVVVVEGKFKDFPNFEAKTVLAKHDENYRPPGTEEL